MTKEGTVQLSMIVSVDILTEADSNLQLHRKTLNRCIQQMQLTCAYG